MLNFLKETQTSAKSVDEAIDLALEELKVTNKDDVTLEILDEGSKGFLGIGSKEAVVKATLKNPNAALAKTFLSQVFAAMQTDVSIAAESASADELNIELSGENMGLIIGKRGDTLDSLQYLTSLVVNHENEDYVKVTIDTENYREKRVEALLALAERLAQKVARTGKKYTLEPMNPYERRIIHSTLQNNEEVTTFSIGVDPYRKIVIAPKNAQGYKKPHTSSSVYAETYSNYKKTAPRYDTVKKAENFEAYQSAHEEEISDSTEE